MGSKKKEGLVKSPQETVTTNHPLNYCDSFAVPEYIRDLIAAHDGLKKRET
jgi:hypothetical protein